MWRPSWHSIWFGRHLRCQLVFLNIVLPRDLYPHLISHSIKQPSCDDQLGILSDLVDILDAILQRHQSIGRHPQSSSLGHTSMFSIRCMEVVKTKTKKYSWRFARIDRFFPCHTRTFILLMYYIKKYIYIVKIDGERLFETKQRYRTYIVHALMSISDTISRTTHWM